MSDDNHSDRSYRRGAIMGLTLAEAFILIAFALLLLFAFWQWEKAKENTPELQVINELPPEQKQLILALAENGSLNPPDVELAQSRRFPCAGQPAIPAAVCRRD